MEQHGTSLRAILEAPVRLYYAFLAQNGPSSKPLRFVKVVLTYMLPHLDPSACPVSRPLQSDLDDLSRLTVR